MKVMIPGGWNSQREVSPSSGSGVKALPNLMRDEGHIQSLTNLLPYGAFDRNMMYFKTST